MGRTHAYFCFSECSHVKKSYFLFGSMSKGSFKNYRQQLLGSSVYRNRIEVSMHIWNFEEMNIMPQETRSLEDN